MLREPKSPRRRGVGIGEIFDCLSPRLVDPDPVSTADVTFLPLSVPAYDDGNRQAIDRLCQSYMRLAGHYGPSTHGGRRSQT